MNSEELLEQEKKALLDMLTDITGFFDENDIRYSLSFGTALGAVRHGGYIPWDDDIDIDMHISQLKKLNKIWKQKYKGSLYFLQNKDTDPYIPNYFTKIRKNGTTSVERKNMHIPIHWGISIDIFPYYNKPDSRFIFKIMKASFNRFKEWSKYAFDNYDSASSLKIKAYNFMSKATFNTVCFISAVFGNKSVAFYPSGNPDDRIFNMDILEPQSEITFEGVRFSCPNRINDYLQLQFGDYMKLPPEEQRHGHVNSVFALDKDFREYINSEISTDNT